MIHRRFKPGDRVQKRGKGKKMVVLKYAVKKYPIIGTYTSEHDVECVWFENGNRKKSVFDQRSLTKVTKTPYAPQLDFLKDYNRMGRLGPDDMN